MSNLIKEHIAALQRKASEALAEEADKKDGAEDDENTEDDKKPKAKDSKSEVNVDPKLNEEDDEGEDEDDDEDDEDDDKDDAKAVKESVYAKVLGTLIENSDVTVDDTLFKSICESQEFDSEFTAQVSSVFSAAVADAVSEKVKQLAESAAEISSTIVTENFATVEAKANAYTEYANDYLNHVVTEWVAENKVELVESIRMERATAFMEDMQCLFGKYNMEIPSDKINLYEEVCTENLELQERAEQLEEANISIGKELIMSVYTKDMSALATERLSKIAESIEYTGDTVKFIETLDILREGVTGKRQAQESVVNEDFSDPITESTDDVVIDNMSPEVRAAVAAISRTNR